MSATLEISEALRSEVISMTSDLPPDEELRLQVVTGEGAPLAVPSHVARFMRAMLESIAAHGSVQAQAIPQVVTTTVAASMLGISRPTLMKLIRDGAIPCHKVGTHTRLRSADVSAFLARRSDDQRAAFASLREVDEALEGGA